MVSKGWPTATTASPPAQTRAQAWVRCARMASPPRHAMHHSSSAPVVPAMTSLTNLRPVESPMSQSVQSVFLWFEADCELLHCVASQADQYTRRRWTPWRAVVDSDHLQAKSLCDTQREAGAPEEIKSCTALSLEPHISPCSATPLKGDYSAWECSAHVGLVPAC